MKKLGLLGLLLAPLFLLSQNTNRLLLATGTVETKDNIHFLSNESAAFVTSLFLNKHYVILHFKQLPTEVEKRSLANNGVLLMDYLPINAYTASVKRGININVLKSNKVIAITTLTAHQKAMPALLESTVPVHAAKVLGYADLSVLTYEKMDWSIIQSYIEGAGGSLVAEAPMFNMFTIRVPTFKIKDIINLPFVQWVEYIDPPNQPENLPGRTLHRVNVLQDGVRNLKGDGMNIGVWDEVASQHLDFSPAGRLTNVETGTAGSHGTHVSGTVGGRGIINPAARGMAPYANIFSYNGFNNDVQVEMATAVPTHTLISSNHSYHDGLGVQCGTSGASASYSLRARNTDINLNNFGYHIHCHSSGNAQTSCTSGWGTITGTGKAAKNNLVVGNITTAEVLSGSSSCGPVHDGRVKPEIVAMGTNVLSTYTPLNSYGTISGTSMSTPGVTGTVALLAQRYKQLNGNVLPPSMLIKNIVCNTAFDLGNVGPDYRFGFGRINALKAVKVLEDNRYTLDNVIQGQTKDVILYIPAGASKLNVMLTWNDPAAAANAALALVNNLDLIVTDGASTTTLPWILNAANPSLAATKAVDNVSNIEQVTIDNPPAGIYIFSVTGTSIPSGPSQAYALTWNIDQPYIEVIYPNGNESLNPGTTETITWDNSGITGTQTVEYSLDGSTNWITIGTVSANTTRLSWVVPTANTAIAKIRVTSGALTDISDAGFKILNTVTGFSGNGTSCNPGEINFTWTSVANATHYDIYRLDATTAEFILLAGNVTGSTYTATGLTPNTSMWFTIRAKNNTTNAESERATAVNVTVSNGGGGLGVVGAISGPATICGAQSNITYTIAAVSGASTYTWAVPTGASISSGQGTNSIIVSYPVGSNTGTISVFAGNGICNTAPSNLSVTVNTTPVAQAISGGNQIQNVCPGNAIPTLTASATVPAGHTVIWYDQATGGNTVNSPILNTVGTVTYYALSKENVSGCESSSRTSVTLTITANRPAAPTNANNQVQNVCPGNNILTLTATATVPAGQSIVWYNAASGTTQVSNPNLSTFGSVTYYAASIENATGCESATRVPVTLAINNITSGSVSALGPTTFCSDNNVTLAATNGDSYAWSNGATSSSINVNTSGSYSVTITKSGCVTTPAPIVVNVSPKPVVTINALPYSALYPGLSTTLTANVTPSGNYLYTWFKDNSTVSGAITNVLSGITIEKLGTYRLVTSNVTGLPCSTTSNEVIISDSATSRIYILPNPNQGVFDVIFHSNVNTSYTLTIVDGKGALVYKKTNAINLPYQRMPVDIRQHGKGLYYVNVFSTTGKRLATAKVVTQ
jgi:hypothetical protein